MVKKGNKQMYLPGKISKADLLIDAISKKKHMYFLVELPNFEQKEQWNKDDWLNIVLMKENLIRIFFVNIAQEIIIKTGIPTLIIIFTCNFFHYILVNLTNIGFFPFNQHIDLLI